MTKRKKLALRVATAFLIVAIYPLGYCAARQANWLYYRGSILGYPALKKGQVIHGYPCVWIGPGKIVANEQIPSIWVYTAEEVFAPLSRAEEAYRLSQRTNLRALASLEYCGWPVNSAVGRHCDALSTQQIFAKQAA